MKRTEIPSNGVGPSKELGRRVCLYVISTPGLRLNLGATITHYCLVVFHTFVSFIVGMKDGPKRGRGHSMLDWEMSEYRAILCNLMAMSFLTCE